MTLQPHNIKPVKGSRHRAKTVGRGNASGHGTYSTRGGKGQTARSGGSHGLKVKGFKRIMQSTPKLPGFRSLNTKPAEVRLNDLEKKFQANEIVNLATLKERKIVGKNFATAKIILKGELTKKLSVEGVACTVGAKNAIEKAGGSIK